MPRTQCGELRNVPCANVLSSHIVDGLGLEVRENGAIGTAGGQVDSGTTSATLTLGSWTFEDDQIVVVDREHLRSKLLGITVFEVAGILGWPVLGAGRTTLDYASERMTLTPSAEALASPIAWRDAPLLDVTVAGVPALLVLDTGASMSLLEGEAAEGVRLEEGRARSMNGGPGADPIPFRRSQGEVEVSALGMRRRFRSLDVASVPTGPPDSCGSGALGSDFFQDGALVLAGPSSTAEFHPRAP